MDGQETKIEEKPKKTRRPMRKRASFKRPPHPAFPVRGLWEGASEEERTKAHVACMAILEYWLGRATKTEIAERLAVTPLRVWQLSQQALSGMLAGLLRQPRSRGKVVLPPARPQEDPKMLQRRIAELEVKLERTEDLVRVLKELPWQQQSSPSVKEARDAVRKRKKRSSKRARRGEPVSTKPARANRESDDAGRDATG